MNTKSETTITIGLITYQRPRMLCAAMQSLRQLVLPADADISLVLVDNDDTESARAVFDEIAPELPFAAQYDTEPVKGIPYARNRVLRHAIDSGADYLCFFDDDDTVDPEWLWHLVEGITYYQCAAVRGRKMVEYTGELPDWAHDTSLFARDSKVTGDCIKIATTANVIYDLAFLQKYGLAFDTRFTQTGGSDRFLSAQIRKCGGTIRYIREAVVFEHYPASKITINWVMKRNYRYGINDARKQIFLDGWTYYILNLVPVIVKRCSLSTGCIIKYSVKANPSYRIYAMLHLSRLKGHIAGAFGHLYNEYDEIHGH